MWLKRFKTQLFSFIFLLGIITQSIPLHAQRFQFKGRRTKETLNFKLVKNLMIIPLTINGKGPFNFILDTGVGLFIISDTSLIDNLNIQSRRSIKIMGFGSGVDLSAYVTPSIQVKIGNSVANNLPAALLKKDIFELSSFVGMPIHGLVGFDFFDSFTVRINYISNTITFYKPEAAYIPRKGQRIPITIEERKPYIISNITLSNGEKISAKLILDTGAGHPISLETQDGIPFPLPQQHIPANLGVGLTGQIRGYIGRISSIKLGKYQLNNVISAFPNYDDVAAKVTSLSRNGNIGNTILRRFIVVFDYHRQCIYLKPAYQLKEPFEHDMSGMEITSGGPEFNRIFITRVEKDSPAAKLGLQTDDEIVSINFKAVSEMSIEEIDKLFRSKNERSFILSIVPNGSKEISRVILTLERRI
ncbi:MAG: peptide-binding protein [Daejeonella sp.]|nr:peptide-binding protein [Daejeonella sp.]